MDLSKLTEKVKEMFGKHDAAESPKEAAVEPTAVAGTDESVVDAPGPSA
jgi:hypothetical protein